jgi:hypothetical protein
VSSLKTQLPVKKSKFAITFGKNENNTPDLSSTNSKKTTKNLKTLSRDEQEKEFSKVPSSGSNSRPSRRKIMFEGQKQLEDEETNKSDKEESKLLQSRVFWPQKKRKGIDPKADNSFLEIIN